VEGALQWSCYKCGACSFPIGFRDHQENVLACFYVLSQTAHECNLQYRAGSFEGLESISLWSLDVIRDIR